MALLHVLCVIYGATPGLGARIMHAGSNRHNLSREVAFSASSPNVWGLNIKGINCYVPNFAPMHGIKVDKIAASDSKLLPPLHQVALKAMTHMTKLAVKTNCHLCDATLWGSYDSGSAHWEASCAAARAVAQGSDRDHSLGKKTGKEGACFSVAKKDSYGEDGGGKDTGEILETTPMPDLDADDCRQCPPQCSSCVPEYSGKIFGRSEFSRFKCVLKEKPFGLQMQTPVPGYDCDKATKRKTNIGQYKTRCQFPGKGKCAKKGKTCPGVAADYMPFWPKAEKKSRKAESEKLTLGVVDCISPSPVKLKLAGHMKHWDKAHAKAAQEMWKLSASRNVDHCTLSFVFEKGHFIDVEVDDAIKQLGKDACSTRNGPLQNRKWSALSHACNEGKSSCCLPCPHACKSCSASKDGQSFKCKLKTVSPAFSSKLAMFLDSEYSSTHDPLPPLRGFRCHHPTEYDRDVIECSTTPEGNYAILPQAPAESTIPEKVNEDMSSFDNQKSQLVMGLYDAAPLPEDLYSGPIRTNGKRRVSFVSPPVKDTKEKVGKLEVVMEENNGPSKLPPPPPPPSSNIPPPPPPPTSSNVPPPPPPQPSSNIPPPPPPPSSNKPPPPPPSSNIPPPPPLPNMDLLLGKSLDGSSAKAKPPPPPTPSTKPKVQPKRNLPEPPKGPKPGFPNRRKMTPKPKPAFKNPPPFMPNSEERQQRPPSVVNPFLAQIQGGKKLKKASPRPPPLEPPPGNRQSSQNPFLAEIANGRQSLTHVEPDDDNDDDDDEPSSTSSNSGMFGSAMSKIDQLAADLLAREEKENSNNEDEEDEWGNDEDDDDDWSVHN